ncbi:DUF4824 family protein [Accumulibacter sp.]|uniref:DUF4824 family protein n=1 Tax=Accumulibacter sp. TaxID=2053492 RepID=UPI0026043381|nr:DUF4824 family protein [Accumulibacter sp.]
MLTNAIILSGIAHNRVAEPESRATLSERELALPYGVRQIENSGLALTLNWRLLDADSERLDYRYAPYGTRPAWLDAERLAALGFDTSGGAATEAARERFTRQLPRQVLVVLEFEGPAWRQAVERARTNAARRTAAAAANPDSQEFARQAQAGREGLALEEGHASRLFAIDAGLDASALRARYPDRGRFLILRGTVRPSVRGGEDRQYRLAGFLGEIAIDRINVPFALRPPLEPLRDPGRPAAAERTPRYLVQIAIGQRLEPWIEHLTMLPADAPNTPAPPAP